MTPIDDKSLTLTAVPGPMTIHCTCGWFGTLEVGQSHECNGIAMTPVIPKPASPEDRAKFIEAILSIGKGSTVACPPDVVFVGVKTNAETERLTNEFAATKRILEVEAHRAELAERSAKLADGLLAEANAQKDEANRLLLSMVRSLDWQRGEEPTPREVHEAARAYLATRGLLPVTE